MVDEEKKEIPEKIKKFITNKKLLNILKSGKNRFDNDNVDDYVCLSNIAPQDTSDIEKPCERVTIEADKDVFIVGRGVTLSGFCIKGGTFVRLVAFGPGEYAEGIEIAAPKVTPTNIWKYHWEPGYSIPPGMYTFTVFDSNKQISDNVIVKAEKGAVTIVVSGYLSYYIGEKIKFQGTSTASESVYLFIWGGTNAEKIGRKIDQLSIVTKNNEPSTFVKVNIRSDNTWSYDWDTSLVGTQLDIGTYTAYAIEGPFTLDNLFNKAFGTVSFIIKRPFISATSSQSVVAKGDRLYITGTAEGGEYQKIQVWIFGETFFHVDIVRAFPDASFKVDLTRIVKEKLAYGQYFVIVQHPMMNNEFDVYLDTQKENVLSNSPNKGTRIFSLQKSEPIHGFDLAKKILAALNDQGIDDTYTTLQFLVETPVIVIGKIGDKYPGDKFTITTTTNLAVDDEVLCKIFQQGYIEKINKFGDFYGATGVVKVVKGNSGLNSLSFDVDTTNWRPDKYVVTFTGMVLDVISETTFNIIS
ncbi:MAG: hypothetical protein WC626_08910 [Methanoregula sp.]